MPEIIESQKKLMTKKNWLLVGSGTVILFLTLVVTYFGARAVLNTAPIYIPEAPITIWYLLFIFLMITAGIVFLLRFMPGRILFSLFFALAMFTGIWFIADAFLPGEVALIVGAAFVLFRYLNPRVIVQDLLVVFGIGGVAVSLGLSLPWQTVLLLSMMLSIYDIVAVYFTKHMVTMMRGLLARGVVFAAVLPEEFHAFFERLDRVHPGEGFMLIGTGDLAIPAIFIASLVPVSPIGAILAGVGSIAGFAITTDLFLGPSDGKPMPALPPIVAGMIVGFLISLIIIT